MVSQTYKHNEVLDGRYGIELHSTKVLTSKVLRFLTRPHILQCPKSKKSTLVTHQVPFPPPKPCFILLKTLNVFVFATESLATQILPPYWISKKRYVGFLKCLKLTSVSPQSFRRKLKQYGYGTLAAGDIPENGGSSPYLFQSDFSTS